MGPFGLSVPLSWYIVPLVILVFALLGIAWNLRARLQRRRFLRGLDERQSALSPLAELHQRSRRLRRGNGIFSGVAPEAGETLRVVSESEAMLRTYLMRRFRLPFLEWTDRVLLRTFRRENRAVFADRGVELTRVLREFAAARAVSDLPAADAIQLSNDAVRVAEVLDRHQAEIENARTR
jgi:hypothetical protein